MRSERLHRRAEESSRLGACSTAPASEPAGMRLSAAQEIALESTLAFLTALAVVLPRRLRRGR